MPSQGLQRQLAALEPWLNTGCRATSGSTEQQAVKPDERKQL